MKFEPGDIVRLVHDPGRIGTVTKCTRAGIRGTEYQVQFSDGFTWVPEDQLELADSPKDPLDLLRAGTLSPASDLRRVLTHARLGGRLQDVIYSLFTTRTDFYPHQFKPVLRLLSGVSDGILIADEVGLGKTIEAGLIWTELRSRFDYTRLFVLCPAVLCKKWQFELHNRFGVKADIVNATGAHERLRAAAASAPGEGFALIGSMQGLRPPSDWRMLPSERRGSAKLAELLEEQAHDEPLVDMLVIDEAHHMRNTNTATSELGQLFRAVSTHVVLLSATPVNLSSDDLFSLMQLVDPDTFADAWEFQDILRANRPLVLLRDKILQRSLSAAEFQEHVREAQSHPILRDSRTLARLVDRPPSDGSLADPRDRAALAHQLDQMNLLGQVVNRTRKRHVEEHRIIRKAVAHAVELSGIEADFYRRVTAAVRAYCESAGGAVGFMLTTPQRLMASSIPAAFRHWTGTRGDDLSGTIEDEDDTQILESGEGTSSTELGVLVRELMNQVSGLGTYETLKQADSKYKRLRDALKVYFEECPEDKVVVFTSFRATLQYLHERLREDRVVTATMHGDTDDKDAVIRAFREHAGPIVLLSSEVGSEGVDLQFARLVVNYDLPWNPMRVEQRIGRLDRLGQKADSITIWNMFCADTIDARIHDRLYLRIGIFQQALGGLEPILGEPIAQLTRDLLMDTITVEQEMERIEATALAIENKRRDLEELEENSAQFFALGDYLLHRVRDAQRLGRHVQAEDLRNYVIGFLRVHHPDSDLTNDPDDPQIMNVRLDLDAKIELASFVERNRLGRNTWLMRPGAGAVRCRFENTVMDVTRDGEEVISQFHPLVRYARERLKEREADLKLCIAVRIRHRDLTMPVFPGRYAFAIERWGVSGIQETETLAYEVSDVRSLDRLDEEAAEALVNQAARAGSNWLEAQTEVDHEDAVSAVQGCLKRLSGRFDTFDAITRLQNDDRARVLMATLERQVERQIQRIEEINENLRARGLRTLVAANEGRIRRLDGRRDMRRKELHRRSAIRINRTLFLVGLISVDEDRAWMPGHV